MVRHALAGQSGRVDGKCMNGLEGEIRGDPVALGQEDEVSHNQVLGRDFESLPVANDRHPAGQQVAQPLRRMLGPFLLHEREDPVQHDHEEDRDTELGQTRHEREDPGDPKQQGEEVHHLRGQPSPCRRAPRHG